VLRKRGRRRGFTLLELLIVITIVAVVIGIGLPRFQSVFDVQIKSAVRKLIGTIQYTFHEAAIKKGTYRLVYNIDEQMYSLTRLAMTGEFLQEDGSMVQQEILPQGIYFTDVVTLHAGKIDKGETFTQFFPNGFAEPTVIHLHDEYGAEYTLIVQPLTGRTEVYDRYLDVVEGEEGSLQ
jgi:prepilin-type N-terminal cleavage/methylation domain-containing protein